MVLIKVLGLDKMSKLKLKKKMQDGKVKDDELGIKINEKNSITRQRPDDTDTGDKRSLIIRGGISSAYKHNINLEPGRQNSGGGNCSYLSVIYNINDRECFLTKFPMSPDYYRRVWNIDLMNKVLDKRIPWNPGLTRQEIQAGFQEIMESGVYERSFFGDMMMAGIACGVKKRILIFNTNENTIHDPVSVVDPRDYGSYVDSKIPVVIAYNMAHFESLHPVQEKDIEETVKLANSYSSGSYVEDYGFTKEHMSYLISSKSIVFSNKKYSVQECGTHLDRSPPPKKTKYFEMVGDTAPLTTKKNDENTSKMEAFIYENILFKETESGKIVCGVCEIECSKLIVHMNGNKYCTEYFSDMVEFKRKYSQFRDKRSRTQNATNETAEHQKIFEANDSNPKSESATKVGDATNFKFGGFDFEELENGRIRCGVCQVECIRLVLHINGSPKCAEKFEMQNFKTEYSRYRHNKRVKEHQAKKKAEDPTAFKLNLKKRVQESQARKKSEDPKAFKDNQNKNVKECESRKKAEDLKAFQDNHKKRNKESDARKKSEDPKAFKENARQRKLKSNNNVSASKRLINFRRKTKYGPIFICSSCHQKLFENQVVEITDEIRDQINKVDPGIMVY